MSPIEILAIIFAVLTLVKLLITNIFPKTQIKIAKAILNRPTLTGIISFILSLIVGYYILTTLSIVQVAATMLLLSLLIGVAYSVYSKKLLSLIVEIVKEKRKAWLVMSIWAVIAIWILFTILS